MTHPNNVIWAIVPAAGIGQRIGGLLPKQYVQLGDKPILTHTLNTICQIPHVRQVIVPLHPLDQYWQRLIHLPYKNYVTIIGGELRFESVFNALTYLKNLAQPQDWVLVHDAVRPCITKEAVTELLQQIDNDPVGGLWGVPVCDTLKKVDAAGKVLYTVPREQLWHAQTPQIFRFELLYLAFAKVKQDKIIMTDEASAIEYLGYHPKMVQGRYDNIKITWPEDLQRAMHWLGSIDSNEVSTCE